MQRAPAAVHQVRALFCSVDCEQVFLTVPSCQAENTCADCLLVAVARTCKEAVPPASHVRCLKQCCSPFTVLSNVVTGAQPVHPEGNMAV